MLSVLLLLSLANVRVDSILAVPINEAFLNHQVIRGFFADLLAQGGFGNWKTERAAFLVMEENGEYRCLAWPMDGRLHRQEFGGEIPDRTVAIIHTHPKGIPLGSTGDQRTAKALTVPIFVLTPHNIYLVTPRGENIPVVANEIWAAVSASSSNRCIARDSHASRRK